MNNKVSVLFRMALVALFAALICICSWITLPSPFSVPFTLQTLAVILAGLLLNPKEAALTGLVYFLLGVAGLPVCASFHTLYTNLFSPSGGYIIGIIVTPFLVSLIKKIHIKLIKRPSGSFVLYLVISIAATIIVIDIPGVIILKLVTGIKLSSAIVSGALIFLPIDIMKCVLATILATALRKPLEKIAIT